MLKQLAINIDEVREFFKEGENAPLPQYWYNNINCFLNFNYRQNSAIHFINVYVIVATIKCLQILSPYDLNDKHY